MSGFWNDKSVLVTGGTGFVGSHLVSKLKKIEGIREIRLPVSQKDDLRRPEVCARTVKNIDIVIHLAAKVGGIGFNQEKPAEIFYDNLTMGVHLMEESRKANVQKFVAIGTICAYPKFTPTPFHERDLWNGYPEETNAPYGLAKKMLLVQSQAYQEQYKFNAIYLLPVNIYGIKDKFDPRFSHVIPALIKKCVDAMEQGEKQITVWGDGSPTREFLYVEDAAEAILMATEHYSKPEPVNIGTGQEISIRDLVSKIVAYCGFKGEVRWDPSKPNGQPHRCLDVSRAKAEFGFTATTSFDEGLKKVISWYKNERTLRKD